MAEQPQSELQVMQESPQAVMLRIEHQTIIAQAQTHPRTLLAVVEEVKEQLRNFRTFAEQAIYCKPVGRERGGQMKHARGLSIRCAEAVAAAFKYNATSTTVSPIDADHAKVEASFTDYQNGRTWRASSVVPKVFRRENGSLGRHNDDRFYSVVCKAEASRLVRDCILRMVPPGVTSELMRCVEDQLERFLDPRAVQRIVDGFVEFDVDADALQAYFGKRLDSFDVEDRMVLVGLYNGIKSGEIKAAEIFGTTVKTTKDQEPIQDESKRLAAAITAGAVNDSTPPESPPTDAAASQPSTGSTAAVPTPPESKPNRRAKKPNPVGIVPAAADKPTAPAVGAAAGLPFKQTHKASEPRQDATKQDGLTGDKPDGKDSATAGG